MVMIAALLVAVVLAPTPVPAHGTDTNEPAAKAPWDATWTDLLKKSLLLGYDKFARPSEEVINVELSLQIHHFDFDDNIGIMTFDSWVAMSWTDPKLKWNASEYGKIYSLNIPDHEIWQPDIVHYLSASNTAIDQYGNTNCIARYDGLVHWVPPAKVLTFCNMDLTHWPYDEQHCKFIFGSWTYDVHQINIHSDMEVDKDNYYVKPLYLENKEWELVNITKESHETIYPCCENAYVSIEFSVTVKRRSGGIRGLLVISPVIVSAVLTLLMHLLPPRSPLALRIPLAAALSTMLGLSLLYFSHRLLRAKKTPNIVMLYCITLFMVCISGIVSVIVLNISTSRRTLPWAVRKALSSGVARSLQLPKLADHSNAEELQGSVVGVVGSGGEGARILSGSASPARDWLALATAIDRITFIILLILFIIVAIMYSF